MSKSNDESIYDGPCNTVVNKLLKMHSISYLSEMSEYALFVPKSIFDEIELEIIQLKLSVESECVWDFELLIDDTIQSMKLVWLKSHTNLGKIEKLPRFGVKRAFSFLQPRYLQYLFKPFWNPDVITQVNLVLDYHRTQARRWGFEIFNICDLIAFKMAIDDNRFEYENCEFHKIIDRTLCKHIQNGMYMKEGKFDFTDYLCEKQEYRPLLEIFEYLVYHFQKSICSIYWNYHNAYSIKLTNISNISAFLELYRIHNPRLTVREIDASGKCAKVLYEILSQNNGEIILYFELDCEWIYSGDDLINDITEPLAVCAISIETKNSFNFIENFINWLKFTFGTRSKDFIKLRLEKFESINSFIFHDFNTMELHLRFAKLDCELIKMLKKCEHGVIVILRCRIAHDINERFDFIGKRTENKNIFKLLNGMENIAKIEFDLEEHTIGTIFAYVASVMMENKLTKFEDKIELWCHHNRFGPFTFLRSGVDTNFDQIEVSERAYGRTDLYTLLNRLNLRLSDREDFEFYQ